MGDSLRTALALWRRGLQVIPVPPPRPGVIPGKPGDGKVPTIAWRLHQSIRQTEADVVSMFPADTPMNIGIVTGSISGVVAVDVDSHEAKLFAAQRLPYTPWQTKTGKGYHLLYRAPDVRVPNRARIKTPSGRLALDVRGDGGFVIAPGSLHASGVVYREAGDWSVGREELPRFWPGWLERPKQPAPARLSRLQPADAPEVIERARRYLAAIPKPEIGSGSDADTLYAACRLVRGFDLSESDAVALLSDWAGGRPGWTREWIAAKVAHAIRYGTEPVGALR
jgi:hypothetical protein